MPVRGYVGVAFASALLTGCINMASYQDASRGIYNVPSSGVSELDGTRHIRMDNILCENEVVLELYQDTAKALAGLVLVKAGVASIENIGRGESLKVRADETLWSFEPVSTVTARGEIWFGHSISIPTSTKSYLVPEDRLRSMASADKLVVRVHLLEGTYTEATCHPVDGYDELSQSQHELAEDLAPMTGIKQFAEMMDSTSW